MLTLYTTSFLVSLFHFFIRLESFTVSNFSQLNLFSDMLVLWVVVVMVNFIIFSNAYGTSRVGSRAADTSDFGLPSDLCPTFRQRHLASLVLCTPNLYRSCDTNIFHNHFLQTLRQYFCIGQNILSATRVCVGSVCANFFLIIGRKHHHPRQTEGKLTAIRIEDHGNH